MRRSRPRVAHPLGDLLRLFRFRRFERIVFAPPRRLFFFNGMLDRPGFWHGIGDFFWFRFFQTERLACFVKEVLGARTGFIPHRRFLDAGFHRRFCCGFWTGGLGRRTARRKRKRVRDRPSGRRVWRHRGIQQHNERQEKTSDRNNLRHSCNHDGGPFFLGQQTVCSVGLVPWRDRGVAACPARQGRECRKTGRACPEQIGGRKSPTARFGIRRPLVRWIES